MRCLVLTALISMLPALGVASPAPQTRPWHVAIAGGQAVAARGGGIPGYLSLLSLHGLPRVRLDDVELTDLSRLRQFDVVIACWSNFGSEPAMRSLEQFAKEGGIVVTEGWPMPSSSVIPGKRLGPAPCPNMRFVPSAHPLSQGLPELGIVPCAAQYRQSGAIIPDAGSPALVLARYTDEDAPKETVSHLREGNQGAPAVILAPYGKGTILYYGPSLSPDLSPADQPPDHFICRFLKWISQGEVTGRLFTGKVDRAEFVTEQTPPEETADYPAPSGAAQLPPKGFEVLEDAAQLQDFCLTGSLPPSGEARVLVGYWSARDHAELTFGSGKATVRQVWAGKAQPTLTFPLPRSVATVVVARRDGLLTIAADGQPVCPGVTIPCQQGALAVQGLGDPTYQPLAPVHFADGFMREEGFAGEWEAQGGDWRVVTSEGKAETGVNPFNYQVKAAPEAVSLAGDWFWSDIACAVSAQGSGDALGLMVDYASPDDYSLLRLVFGPQACSSRLQLVQRRTGAETVLAETLVTAARGDWHRLELRTSRGRLQGWLNGQLRVMAQGSPTACGRVGLYCRRDAASFDDVSVEPWVASPPEAAPRLEEMVAAGGTWNRDETGDRLSGQSSSGARLLLPWPAVSDCQAEAKVRVGQADAAGLLVQSRDKDVMLVALVRSGQALRAKAYRPGSKGGLLLDLPVPGSPDEWHTLQARYAGPRLQITMDGATIGEVLDAAAAGGAAGLYARGKQPAQFRDFQAWTEPSDERLADEPTPEFAGVIDRNTWAGRSGAWTPDPEHLNRLWHAGYFPGPVQVVAGLHPLGTTETTTLLHLSPPGHAELGYTLRAHRAWAERTVDLELAYAGKTVAHGTAPVAAAAPYGLGLQRCGADVLASVDGKPVLAWRDTRARPELCALGLDNGGQLLVADDIAVSSPQVHNDTFETAPTGWAVESGTWKVSSRWSCSPGWSWFCGENPTGPALAATRQAYTGDMDAVAYFSAKMLALNGRMTEKLTDVHFGCCANEVQADSGYHLIIGAEDNKRTVLLRNGQEVASSPYRLAQGLIHNDWLRLTIKRRGPQVALWIWDTPTLSWTDPQPLAGGRVAIGTERNGVVVPRVTVYGHQEEAAAPVVATAPLRLRPLPLLTFAQDNGKAEFGGDWGLWPQQEGCQGTATFMAGQDAEGKGGGSVKVDYTIKAVPRSFSLYVNSVPGGVDLAAYDRFVLYARGNVPSLTLVIKDATATDPDAPQGIADCVVKGLTGQWQRLEVPFSSFVPRQKGTRIDWRSINHVGLAMMAPQNAESGTFWVDNLRAEAAPGR